MHDMLLKRLHSDGQKGSKPNMKSECSNLNTLAKKFFKQFLRQFRDAVGAATEPGN